MSDLTVRWSDVLDGFRREMLGDRSYDRRLMAGRLLLAACREAFPPGAHREVLMDALAGRLAAIYPGRDETARRIVEALSDIDLAVSLTEDDRGLGLGNEAFEDLHSPRRVAAVG
jgi:hypothetical protein